MERKDKLYLSDDIITCINKNYNTNTDYKIEIIRIDNLGYYSSISLDGVHITSIYANDTLDYFSNRVDCQIKTIRWFVNNILDT